MEDSLPNAEDAADVRSPQELNQEFVQALVAGWLKDPEVDLASLVPSSYKDHIRKRKQQHESKTRSELAKVNWSYLRGVLSKFDSCPTSDLADQVRDPYNAKYQKALGIVSDTKTKAESVSSDDDDHFSAALDEVTVDTFEVVMPLSSTVSDLLGLRGSTHGSNSSVKALKDMVRESECLWTVRMGAWFVAKTKSNIVVKVTTTSQISHSLALRLIAEHAPEVLVPKFHGLLRIDDLDVMFMSHIPGSTLTAARPKLDQHQKISLQAQLDDIFSRIRLIKRDGTPLDLLDAREWSINVDFKFSYRPFIANNYVEFLKDLLPASRYDEECILTHCDVRNDNIMVDQNHVGDWIISGVIDWEEAGFYPPYWEAVKTTRAFLANHEDDYHLMQPPCIAPATFARHWLVDRHWEELVRYHEAWVGGRKTAK